MPEQEQISSNMALSEPTPEAAASYEKFVRAGFLLVKAGKYFEAMQHYRNPEAARRVGFVLEDESGYVIVKKPIVEPSDQEYYLGLTRQRVKFSFFAAPQITLCSFVLSGQVKPEEISSDLCHEISLLFAEEWLHGMQYLRGDRSLIDNGAFNEPDDPEHDVARYMQLHGVPLTEKFIARYGRTNVLVSPNAEAAA